MQAARRDGRHGHRDATLILITYRHGLRVSEAVALAWNRIDLNQGQVHVHSHKQGVSRVHPLRSLSCGRCDDCGEKIPVHRMCS